MAHTNCVKELVEGDCKAFIVEDCDPLNPRTEFDNIGRMVCAHRRYNLGDNAKTLGWTLRTSDFDGWDAIHAHIEKECRAWVILPLYLYDHSGITMNTTGFSCRWDSGQVGFIYVTKGDVQRNWPEVTDEEELRKLAHKVLLSEVATYDQYLRGEVYGYIIEDKDGNHVDSCYGFFGMADVMEQAEGSLKHEAARLAVAKMNREDKMRMALVELAKVREVMDPAAVMVLREALTLYNLHYTETIPVTAAA